MSDLTVRSYEDSDYGPCRDLWAALTAHHREIYSDETIGGDDPGGGFDDYLRRADRVGSWVATVEDTVVGLTGLLWKEDEAEIEPVVVADARRGEGAGRVLIEAMIDEARRRGASSLSIRPVARNRSAVEAFHHLGFTNLGHLDMFMDLGADGGWLSGIEVHGRDFRY